MDSLKKRRGVARSRVTKICTSVEAEIIKDPVDVLVLNRLLEKLRTASTNLKALDLEIYEELSNDDEVGEDELEEEVDGCEEYEDKVNAAMSKISDHVKTETPEEHNLKQLTEKRVLLRSTIDAALVKVNEELQKDEKDVGALRGLLQFLRNNRDKLSEFDDQISAGLSIGGASQEDRLAEEEMRAEYEMKVCTALEMLADSSAAQGSPTPSVYSTAAEGLQQSDLSAMSRAKPVEFNGDLKEWIGWWGQYEGMVHKRNVEACVKFHHLRQWLKKDSEPYEAIKQIPPNEKGYQQAIDKLKDKYGREDVLLQVYLRELLGLVIQNASGREKMPLGKLELKFNGYLDALENLNLSQADPSTYFFPLIESSLPSHTLRAWQRSPNSKIDGSLLNPPKSKLTILREFVAEEVRGEDNVALAQNAFQQKPVKDTSASGDRRSKPAPKKSRQERGGATQAELFGGNTVNSDSKCIFCGKGRHPSSTCFTAEKMSMDVKQKKIKDSGRCFKCIDKCHQAMDCKESVKCSICNRAHVTFMCRDHSHNKSSLEERNQEHLNSIPRKFKEMVVGDQASLQLNSHQAGVMCSSSTALNTVLVRVIGPDAKKNVVVRLLLDEGSQSSHITTTTANEVGSKPVGVELVRAILFDGSCTEYQEINKHEVTLSSLDESKQFKLVLKESQRIGGQLPRIRMGPWMDELKKQGIYPNDVMGTHVDRFDIDVVIGIDYRNKVVTRNAIDLECGLRATETIFGWALGGPVPYATNHAQLIIYSSLMAAREVQQMWDLDVLGIRDPAEKKSKEDHEEAVKREVQSSLTRKEDGRYVVGLPWIMENPSLPTNRGVAMKRLERATETKLKTREDFTGYDKVFRAWEQEGIIEEARSSSDRGHYLPHRPVFKPESLTTPIRPVFDASCKVNGHPSLNQCLEKGPNMLEMIPSILLRFREGKVGGIADIRKAFQMIEVQEEDRKFQKFLWWGPRGDVRELQHCRVVFGMNCSPFILAAVLDHLLKTVPESDKEIAERTLKCLYVDNCVVSFSTVAEYDAFKEGSTRIMATGKMELREWERTGQYETGKQVTGVLGMKWDKSEDVLFCNVSKEFENVPEQVTKREVLSAVARVFDPIGITAPALIQPKIQIQESWALGLGWDEPWPEEKKRKFEAWVKEVDCLGSIRVPRFALGTDWELHVFVDASQDAYAAVVFARSETGEEVKIQLLLAKARLAPLAKKGGKRVTIPRLELLGCLIGVRLGKVVKEAFEKPDVPTHYWSDSTTALAWIKRNEDWGTFVGNRVREIRAGSDPEQWRHVPGTFNPADLPSRGCSPSELLESRWWEGPDWLLMPKCLWPPAEEAPVEEDVIVELKKSSLVATQVIEATELRFSRYLSNVRVAGWIRRFVNNCRDKKCKRYGNKLGGDEVKLGERDLIYCLQQRQFQQRPRIRGKVIREREDGVLVVETRLTNLEDEEDFKSPMLLPRKDPLVAQLIRYVHESCGHGGTQVVLGLLRERYWVLQNRRAVDSVIFKCVTCRRYAAKSLKAEAAPLPQKRIQAQYAFQTTGVDLAGPLTLKDGQKVWIVLYTCAVFRGVHLDLVDSLSGETFLRSLERFVSVIGRPNNLYSDNGTNFVAAKGLMDKLVMKLEDLSTDRIRWILNPPASPWWGGFYERLIQSTKGLLRRMLGKAKVSFDEMRTLLASVTNTINERPLTTITEDGADLIPLTPAMFMRGLPVGVFPEGQMMAKDLRGAYRKMQELKGAVTARFRKEYLGILVQRGKQKGSRALEVGEVVLVGTDNKKRYEWPMAKIIELIPGGDDKVRLAKVKTTNGILLCPPERLFPLEVRMSDPVPITPETLPPKKKVVAAKKEPEVQEEPVHVTKAGRKVKKPARYGQWFHQVIMQIY